MKTPDLEIGARVKTLRRIERYPHFVVEVGKRGTVTELTDKIVAVKMDDKIINAAEWDNCVIWEAEELDDVAADIETIFADHRLQRGFKKETPAQRRKTYHSNQLGAVTIPTDEVSGSTSSKMRMTNCEVQLNNKRIGIFRCVMDKDEIGVTVNREFFATFHVNADVTKLRELAALLCTLCATKDCTSFQLTYDHSFHLVQLMESFK